MYSWSWRSHPISDYRPKICKPKCQTGGKKKRSNSWRCFKNNESITPRLMFDHKPHIPHVYTGHRNSVRASWKDCISLILHQKIIFEKSFVFISILSVCTLKINLNMYSRSRRSHLISEYWTKLCKCKCLTRGGEIRSNNWRCLKNNERIAPRLTFDYKSHMCTLATAIVCVHLGKAVSLWPSIRNNIREQFRCAFCCSYPWVSSNIIVTSSQNVGNPYLLKDIDLNNLSSTYVKWMKSQRYCAPPTSTINARHRQRVAIYHLSSSPCRDMILLFKVGVCAILILSKCWVAFFQSVDMQNHQGMQTSIKQK